MAHVHRSRHGHLRSVWELFVKSSILLLQSTSFRKLDGRSYGWTPSPFQHPYAIANAAT